MGAAFPLSESLPLCHRIWGVSIFILSSPVSCRSSSMLSFSWSSFVWAGHRRLQRHR